MPPRKTPHRAPPPIQTEEVIEKALQWSKDHPKVHDPDAVTKSGLSRMVDMRIPLVWLLTAVGSFAAFQIMLWSSAQQTNIAMQKMQATLEAFTAQTAETRGDVNRLKDRVDRVMDDSRTMQQQINQIQQQQYQQQRPTR